jgi:hypothetical protein
MACDKYDELDQALCNALIAEDRLRFTSPQEEAMGNDLRTRSMQAAFIEIQNAARMRNSHITTCEMCKADKRSHEYYSLSR